MQHFIRNTGTRADVKELEFISAIHQSSKEIRPDGSISISDVKNFLMSRYGLEVSKENINDEIFKALGGGFSTKKETSPVNPMDEIRDSLLLDTNHVQQSIQNDTNEDGEEDDDGEEEEKVKEKEEVLDLLEIVATLLIPYLVKMKQLSDVISLSSNSSICDEDIESSPPIQSSNNIKFWKEHDSQITIAAPQACNHDNVDDVAHETPILHSVDNEITIWFDCKKYLVEENDVEKVMKAKGELPQEGDPNKSWKQYHPKRGIQRLSTWCKGSHKIGLAIFKVDPSCSSNDKNDIIPQLKQGLVNMILHQGEKTTKPSFYLRIIDPSVKDNKIIQKCYKIDTINQQSCESMELLDIAKYLTLLDPDTEAVFSFVDDDDDVDPNTVNDLIQKGETHTRKLIMPESPDLIDILLSEILIQCGVMTSDTPSSSRPRPVINSALIKKILHSYGEEDLANDDELIENMVQTATGGREDVPLNSSSFLRGLTKDVSILDVDKEMQVSTHFDDVFLEKKVSTQSSRRRFSRSYTMSNVTSNNNSTGVDNGWFNNMMQRASEIRKEVYTKVSNGLSSEINDEKQGKVQSALNDDTKDANKSSDATSKVFKVVKTAEAIDMTSDTSRSRLLTMLVWCFFLLTAFTHLPTKFFTSDDWFNCVPTAPKKEIAAVNATAGGLVLTIPGLTDENENPSIGCTIANSVVNWIILSLMLGIGGTIFIRVLSVGNGIKLQSRYPLAIGLITTLVALFVPFFVNGHERKLGVEHVFLHTITLVAGLLVVVLQVWNFLQDNDSLPDKKFFDMFKESGNIVLESKIKQSCVWKANIMIRNAVKIHKMKKNERLKSNPFAQTELNARKKWTDKMDLESISFYWIIPKLVSGHIFSREGIWLSNRLSIAIPVMLVGTCFVFFAGYTLSNFMSDNLAKIYFLGKKQYLDDLRNGVVDFSGNFTEDLYQDKLDEYDDHTGVIKNRLRNIAYFAVVSGTLASLNLTYRYIPTAAGTILQYRNGLIPTLDDISKTFSSYRHSQDSVSNMLGAMFFGCIITGVIIAFLIVVLGGLVAYPPTQQYGIHILAAFIAFGITLGLKQGVLFFVRQKNFGAFYRTNPKVANYTVMGLETWSVILSAGAMTTRALQSMLVSALNLGWIGSPLFAPGISRLGQTKIELDTIPRIFQKELLAHEAHRHPYIERLGLIYCLKLRHQDNFGNVGGYGWRILFVTCLMPWICKYRILTREEEEDALIAEGLSDKMKRNLKMVDISE